MPFPSAILQLKIQKQMILQLLTFLAKNSTIQVGLVQFLTLFLLLLVTGVFWGLWVSLSRSYHLFSVDELAHIGKVIIDNLAMPMRFILLGSMLSLVLSAWIFAHE